MRKYYLALLLLFTSLVGLSKPVAAKEAVYYYVYGVDNVDVSTIPDGEVLLGQTGQIKPEADSIVKDFQYAFRYKVSDPSVLSIDAKGNWKALKTGTVTIEVLGHNAGDAIPEFEAELDAHGIRRAGMEPEVYVYGPVTEVKVVEGYTTVPVYRLYHEGIQQHLYTKDRNEYQVLAGHGWRQEGIAWQTSMSNGASIYRLYQSDLKTHLYTTDEMEYRVLGYSSWAKEGVAYRSHGALPIYRLYHKGLRKHLFTTDANERTVLQTRGWVDEGIAFYGHGVGQMEE